MKKILKIILILISIVITFLLLLFIGTGFTKNPNVEIINYSLNEDGSELKFTIGIPYSIGCTRGYKNKSNGVKVQYLNFYNTFGLINASWGAKYKYVLKLDEDDTEIYFNRTDGEYELVLQKNVETGKWERPNAMKRYAEIRESAKKATEWYLGAIYPNCSISNGTSETYTFKGSENSSWYINQGYIKRNELLDIDEKSYCDIHVKHGAYFENPLDQQRNCAVYYQIYLKCMDYEDKGYVAG